MSEALASFKPLRKPEMAIAAFCGIFTALTFPGLPFGWLCWISLVPFALLVFTPRRKRAMMGLFGSFGAGFYLTLLYWFLAMHPLTWLGLTVPQSLGVVVFAWLASSALLVCQLLGLGYLYGYVSQRWPQPGWRHVLALALGWTSLEWLTSLGPFGFTWGNLALSQYHHLPLIQVLDLVGPFPLAGAIVAFNAALALSLRRQFNQRAHWVHWKPLAAACVPLVFVVAYGESRLASPLPPTTFSVELVQGNIAGSEKWAHGKDALTRMENKYLALTHQHLQTDLVIWPETALPTYLRNDEASYSRMTNEANTEHRYLMSGTLDWSGAQPDVKIYNAVTTFGPRGEELGFDYKRHLVPFGEYVPGRAYIPRALLASMGLMNILGEDFTPGTTPHLFNFPFARIGAGICYDGIFPAEMRVPVQAGAQVLALVTNDSWYKDTTAPRVLNAEAVLRAVENHRYVLRAANTGICAIIEPTGNIQAETPVFQDATLVGRASPMDGLTPYTRWGDWASMLSALGFASLVLVRWKNRKKAIVSPESRTQA
jgi:apolipoprotein N-acyltransferase